MSLDPLLSKKEAAAYLKVATRTITEYRKKGLLKGCKIGGKVLFKQSELAKSLYNDK